MTAAATSFDLDRVRAAVAGTRFAEVRWVAETGSTNADLLALAADGAPEGIVLGADHQTVGRGRRGRTWTAPPGAAVLVSVLLRPPGAAVDLVMPAVAVAAAEAVAAVTGVAPGIKWPNDLVAAAADDPDGPTRKLAGILAEATWPVGADVASGGREPGATERVTVVVGMGLNVSRGGRPADLADTAVACDELVGSGGPSPTREALVTNWLLALDRWWGVARDPGGAGELWAAWRSRSATLGRQVRVDLGTEDLEGIAVAVTPRGQLVVRTPDGRERTLAVGDVTHLRAI